MGCVTRVRSPLLPPGPPSFRTLTPALVLRAVWVLCCALNSCLVVVPPQDDVRCFLDGTHTGVTMSQQQQRNLFQ